MKKKTNNSITILAISGTERKGSNTRKLAYCAKKYFEKHDAQYTIFDLKETPLPMYDEEEQTLKDAHAHTFLRLVNDADAIILSSPEYHNSMAGALKNALDWFNQLDRNMRGRVFGLIGGGGSFANSGAVTQMMMAVRSMHGWMMPDVVVGVPKIWEAFTNDDCLINTSLQKRLDLFAQKLVLYTKMFKENREVFK